MNGARSHMGGGFTLYRFHYERIVMLERLLENLTLQRVLENVTVLLLAGILAGAAGGAVLGIVLEHSASTTTTTH